MRKEMLYVYCPQCGAPANFDIKKQIYRCSYCDGEIQIEKALDEKIQYHKKRQYDLKKNYKEYSLLSSSCSGCGATVVFEENEAMGNCAFCGRSIVRGKYVYKQEMPDSIIPFALTEKEAKERLEQWCNANKKKKEAKHLAPLLSDLKGFYLPYEMIHGPVKCTVKPHTNFKEYICHGYIKDEFINCSKQFDNLLLDGMEPYDLDALSEFNFGYVAGQRVKISDLSARELQGRMIEETENNYHIPLEEIMGTKSLSITPSIGNASKIPVLLPVYYVCKDNIAAAVNGQTGKVSVRAEKAKRYIGIPDWIEAIFIFLLSIAAIIGGCLYSGVETSIILCAAAVFVPLYLMFFYCLREDFNYNWFTVSDYREIYTSGEETFKRVRGKLVSRETLLQRKIVPPVFFEKLDGTEKAVTYEFRTKRRMIKSCVISLAILFFPIIGALFMNGFHIMQLHLQYAVMWFFIMAIVMPPLFISIVVRDMREIPLIYLLKEDGKKERYRPNNKTRKEKIKDALLIFFGLFIAPPICLLTWLMVGFLFFMCRFVAFGI